MDSSQQVEDIADRLARHRLVPFVGAGASLGQLGVGWAEICRDLAIELGLPPSAGHDYLGIADQYEVEFGVDGLARFMARRLVRDKFEDDTGSIHMIVMGLSCGVVYTTNQDNLFELCTVKYGRPYKTIVNLKDLTYVAPADFLLVKYHGDPSNPASLVLSGRSYRERTKDRDHFLNVRMKSDVLAKGFLFIGYSFRDPNVVAIFEELRAAFHEKFPPSYLIPFEYDPDVAQKLSNGYGVVVVNPCEAMPDAPTESEAFERYMSELLKTTVEKKTAREIDTIFRPDTPPSQRIATRYEIDALESVLPNKGIEDAVRLYRAMFDQTLVPEASQDRVAQIFVSLAMRVRGRNASNDMNGALINSTLTGKSCFEALSAVMATANQRDDAEELDIFLPLCRALPQRFFPIAAARAVELVMNTGATVTDAFRNHLLQWFKGYDRFSGEVRHYVDKQMSAAWRGATSESPAEYWKHASNFGLPQKTFLDFTADFERMVPRKFIKPYE
ncbi:MAG: SIR2 family protein [Alphaproteobacteria bacterium]